MIVRRLRARFVPLLATGLVMLAALVASAGSSAQAQELRLTDIAGREVVLAKPASRIVLGAWVSLDALALIHPDPISLLAGWAGEAGANRFQLEPMRQRFAAVDRVPIVGRDTLETMSIEAVVAAKPDAVVLSRYDVFGLGRPTAPLALERLTAAGVPVVIVDFFLDPVANTEPSMRLLGRLLGREKEAEAFIALYKSRIDTVIQRLAKAAPRRPTVFLHAFAARQDCCWTAGPGTGDGLIRLAGGHSIGADVLTAPIGQVSLEYVLSRRPDIYVATGAQDVVRGSRFVLGRGVSQADAVQGLRDLLQRPDLAVLGAVESGNAHGIWHNFSHTPLHVVQVEAFAKWFHPELFGDLDPGATLNQINDLLAVPLQGTLWVDLSAAGKAGTPGGTRR